ncbi:MAG: threonine--tRNA ligase [Bacteroidaceae bacterium]|jgi:threonyl-tRNA synthetase|nr:threonine--tRNA ligase [Bacteroidaceae bacterium]
MKITFLNPGLNEANIEQPCSIIDAIKASNPEALATACAAKVNGTLTDLRATIAEDASVEILDTTSSDALHILRHTTAHILAEAVKRLYPDAKLTIGPATENGFYYDFECKPFTKDELDAIEKEMKAIIKKGPRIERREVSRNEAMEIMSQRGESYKVEILNEIPEDETITIYTQNDFVELCTGPHIINTKMIKGFKLLSASTTYWRGDKNNAVLSRIYGTAFFTKEDLEKYLEYLENIKNRDHNKIGRELEIFATVKEIGQGLPLLLPKGAHIVQTMQRWIEDEESRRGYVRTKTPLMAKSDLYKISGHWGHYKDKMFVFGNEETDNEVFALRPMTCPFQYYVYKNSQRSYRDLPMRLGETSTLFRKEESGEMHGLTRVRQFTISEGHLIVRPDQMVEEFKGCLALAKYCLETLGLQDDVTYHLSKWDPTNTEKYIGDASVWEETQQHIRDILNSLNIPFVEDIGEAAFYGPKVDINAKNVYGKEDTMITIQWDAVLAKQFDMYYIDQNNARVQPYIIHRTSIGCYERTLAWMIEKYEGAFPTWLCPEQVRILPISEKYNDYAYKVKEELVKNGILATVDDRAEKTGYKIRDVRCAKLPYALIVGKNEEETSTVSVWNRISGDKGAVEIQGFIDIIRNDIDNKLVKPLA